MTTTRFPRRRVRERAGTRLGLPGRHLLVGGRPRRPQGVVGGRRICHPPNSRDRAALLRGELVPVLLDALGSDRPAGRFAAAAKEPRGEQALSINLPPVTRGRALAATLASVSGRWDGRRRLSPVRRRPVCWNEQPCGVAARGEPSASLGRAGAQSITRKRRPSLSCAVTEGGGPTPTPRNEAQATVGAPVPLRRSGSHAACHWSAPMCQPLARWRSPIGSSCDSR